MFSCIKYICRVTKGFVIYVMHTHTHTSFPVTRVTGHCHTTLSTTVKWKENIVTSHCVSTTDLRKLCFFRHHINNHNFLTTVVSFTQHAPTLHTNFFTTAIRTVPHIYFPYQRILNCYRRLINLLNFTENYFRNLLSSETFTIFLSQNIFLWLISTVALHLRSSVYIEAQWILSDEPRKVRNIQYDMYEQLARDSSFRCRHRWTRIRSLFTSLIGIITLTR